MSSAKLTLIGLYKWYDRINEDLFKYLNMPEAIDRQVLIDNILLKGGEFEVLYPNADFMQNAISTWSKKWERTFELWVKAQSIEYNPLENYDRIEDWTENSTGKSTDVNSANTLNSVSAFNSSLLQPDNSLSTNSNGTTNLENNNIRQGRTHGNIGVTTSQQMLQSELDIATWNIYEHITDIFLQEFVLPCY